MKRPSGIIFDLGDTVMHEESFSLLDGYARLLQFASSPVTLSAEQVLSFTTPIAREMNELKLRATLEVSLQYFLRLAFDQLGVSFSISYAEMEREFWKAAVVHRPSEGIFEALDCLDAHGIKAGILSNLSFSGEILVEDLAKHRLARRFSFIVVSSDYGFRKPSPQIFAVAICKMGFKPEDIWFVGDRLDNDIQGAQNAGLFPVWYNPKKLPRTFDLECLEVHHWDEFREKIKSLVGI